jgi:hypothetical protein
MCIEPQESYTRAENRRAEDGKLSCAAQIIDLQVRRSVDAADDVCENRQRCDRNRDKSSGKAILAVRHSHCIARPCQDERHEQHV